MQSIQSIAHRLLNMSLLPLGLAGMYAVHLLAAKVYSVDDFGRFSAVLAATSLLAIIITAGIPASAQKFLAAYRAKGDMELFDRFLVFCLYWMSATFVVIVLVSIVSRVALSPDNSQPIVLGAAMTLATSSWLWQRYICLGMGNVSSALIPRDLIVPLCSIPILLFSPPDTIAGFTYIFAFLIGSTALFTLFLTTKNTPYISIRKLQASLPEWLTSSRSFLVSTALQLGLNSWDILLLASLSSMQEAGKYAAASRLAMLILIVVRVTNTLYSHRFSALYSSGSASQLRNLFAKVRLYSFLVSVFLVLLLSMSFSNIQSWLGQGYEDIHYLVILLAATNLVLVAAGPVGQMLNMTGGEHQVAKITGLWSLGSVIANLVLIPFFGSMGAALAYAITNILMRLQLSQTLKSSSFSK